MVNTWATRVARAEAEDNGREGLSHPTFLPPREDRTATLPPPNNIPEEILDD